MALVKREKEMVEENAPVLSGEMKKCYTDWMALEKGEIVPVRVTCQDYQPVHQVDSSCHSNLPITAENIIAHMQPEHGSGGGFTFQLRHRPGQKPKIWQELFDAGVELHDFRCDICDEELQLVPRRIIKHLGAHSGKIRRPLPGGAFLATLRFTRPDEDEGDNYGDE